MYVCYCLCVGFLPQVQFAQRPVFGSALAQGRLNSFSLCNSILRPKAAIIKARTPTAMARTMSIVFIFRINAYGNRILCLVPKTFWLALSPVIP